jgi:hypothetical protein
MCTNLANAGVDQVVSLPQTWTIVDASLSKADTSIVGWKWSQIRYKIQNTYIHGFIHLLHEYVLEKTHLCDNLNFV